MRRHLTFLASGFLAAIIGAAPTAEAKDITMFPPVQGSCVQGQPNLLMWDGATQVKCVQIPVAGSPQCPQWAAGAAAPAPGYPFATSSFLTYQNGALVCVNPQCPSSQVSQWDAQTNSVVCVNPPSP